MVGVVRELEKKNESSPFLMPRRKCGPGKTIMAEIRSG
jgi:hypothetical protein